MNLLPSSTSVTPASDSDTSAEKSPEICEGCGSRDSWITHSARFRCIIHFYCTHCLLRKHPTSFCPSCFAFYDSSPPHHSRRVSCSDCGSYTHIHCAADDANSNSTPYRCPPCRDPDSFSFFRPIVDANGVRCVDKSLSAAFLCAAKISASSMNKAVSLAKCEAERKGKDAAVARKRAREALDDVIKLDEKAKSDVELSANRDQKPSLSPDLAMQIQCLKPSSTGAEDSFIWHQTASGIYSTKSGYFAKMKTFLWSIVHKAISLGSNLHRRGMTSASLCVRCQDTENEMHCFFNCQYAKKVWDLVPLSKAVHLAAGMTFPEVVVKFRKVICLPPSGISLNILPWVLWAIWTARNTLIFEGRYQSPQSQQLQPRAPPQINLDNDQVNCKTDAAWHKDKLVAGLGWVFSGPRLESPIKGSMCEALIGSPLIAEASAVRSAMCMAINLEFSYLEVLSDNLTLIRAISGITQAKEIIGIVKDIRSISTEFASISFAHISRSLNGEADSLAKESLRFSYLL